MHDGSVAYVVLNSADTEVTTFPADFHGYGKAVMFASCLAQAFPERIYTVGKEWSDGTIDDIVTINCVKNRRD
jgi:hypothetical protein